MDDEYKRLRVTKPGAMWCTVTANAICRQQICWLSETAPTRRGKRSRYILETKVSIPIDQERDPEMDPLINDVLGAIFPIFSALGLHSVAPMMRDPSFNEPPIFWGRKGQILMTFLMVVAAVTTTFGIVWMFLVIGWLRTIILLVVVGWLGRTIYRRLPS